jgi:hypothetical protein
MIAAAYYPAMAEDAAAVWSAMVKEQEKLRGKMPEDVEKFRKMKSNTDSHRWGKIRIEGVAGDVLVEHIRRCIDCGQEDTCLDSLPPCPLVHARKWLDSQHPEFSASRQLAKVIYDYALAFVRDNAA